MKKILLMSVMSLNASVAYMQTQNEFICANGDNYLSKVMLDAPTKSSCRGEVLTSENNVEISIPFTLSFRALCCDKTTEPGADEVYILVDAYKNTGEPYLRREPGTASHWDMNDGDQPNDNPNGDSHCITNRTIFSGDLKNGETWYFNIVLAEEDGGSSIPYQTMAANLLERTGDPYAISAGAFIQALTSIGVSITDTDDWMGMFGVKVTNNEGRLNVEWFGKEGIVHTIPDPSDNGNSTKREFRMNHDGSNYVGWFSVQ